MPVLLLQKRPYARSFAFLGGSFVSLMLMGLLFARGLGTVVLRFENRHVRLVPSLEILAGIVLLGIAATVFWQLRRGHLSAEPTSKLKKGLTFGAVHLFLLGAGLVAVQSVLDVVFVIAMIRIGQLHLSSIELWLAVATYTVAALILQLTVVAAYRLTSPKRKQQTLGKVHSLLAAYGNQAVIMISLLLGCGLLIDGLLTF